eukprot:TRINITY_DN27324_c0_g1_i1.p1 TRINITY_DN27324_c0_g1~~TRINITY_DN27324_c0_g1_i1.p1  ORF type:complete len:118 (+),score=3.75 TRINITY_DN27324_c0_g1_i1:313-666(+)
MYDHCCQNPMLYQVLRKRFVTMERNQFRGESLGFINKSYDLVLVSSNLMIPVIWMSRCNHNKEAAVSDLLPHLAFLFLKGYLVLTKRNKHITKVLDHTSGILFCIHFLHEHFLKDTF